MAAPPKNRAPSRRKVDELIEQLIAFLALIIGTLLEGVYLYVLVRIHEPVDEYMEQNSSLCPLKITVFIIGFSFLGLNLITVATFVAIHTRENLRLLKKTFKKPAVRKRCTGLQPSQLPAA